MTRAQIAIAAALSVALLAPVAFAVAAALSGTALSFDPVLSKVESFGWVRDYKVCLQRAGATGIKETDAALFQILVIASIGMNAFSFVVSLVCIKSFDNKKISESFVEDAKLKIGRLALCLGFVVSSLIILDSCYVIRQTSLLKMAASDSSIYFSTVAFCMCVSLTFLSILSVVPFWWISVGKKLTDVPIKTI